VQSNAAVAVEDGIIRAVGDNLAKWRHLPAIDGTGMTLLPGFIDGHVHVRDAGELRQALRFGVTTVLDMGAIIEPEVLYALRRTASATRDMADLRVAGYLLIARGPNEAPVPTGASTPSVATVEEATAFVASRRAEGADHLKIILRGVVSAERGVPNFDAARVQALTDAAHAVDLVAVAHVETLDDVRLALANGVDVVTHVWRREGSNPEMACAVAARHVPVIPVLVVPDSFLPENRSALLSDRRFGAFITEDLREHLGPESSFPLMPVTAAPVEQRRNAATQLAAARSLTAAGAQFDHDKAQATLNAPAAEVLARALAAGTSALVGRQLEAYRIEPRRGPVT
jgi:imidazolonepropionase-like amidohydrolase